MRAWEGGVLHQSWGRGPTAAVLRQSGTLGRRHVLPRASGPAPVWNGPCPCLWGVGCDPQTLSPPSPQHFRKQLCRPIYEAISLTFTGGQAAQEVGCVVVRGTDCPGTCGEDAGFQTVWGCGKGPVPLRARGRLPGPRCHAASLAGPPDHPLACSLQAGPGAPPRGWLAVNEDGPAGPVCPWRRQAWALALLLFRVVSLTGHT